MLMVRRQLSGAFLRWRQLDLATQYLLAGAVSMLLIGLMAGWLTYSLLVRYELAERANETAIFLEGVFSPILQGLAEEGRMSAEDRERVDALLGNAAFSRRFPHLDIWLPSGEVAYSKSALIAGRRFPLPPEAQDAFSGTIGVSFSDATAAEHTLRGIKGGLLEVYAPIHRLGSDEIIAVVEIHESAETLTDSLRQSSLIAWVTVMGSAVLAFACLLGFVLKATRTITKLRESIADRLKSLLRLQDQLTEAELAARQAAERAQMLADKRLRLASADLHDGPSQLISFALLKARETKTAKDQVSHHRGIDALETALVTALTEIRSIGQGLSIPDLAELPPDAVIDLALKAHVRRTAMEVARQGGWGDLHLGLEHKICLYRLVQEGLNNAFRHAPDGKPVIQVLRHAQKIEIKIINHVTAEKTCRHDEGSRMGLEGLRMRVENLGGSFSAGVVGDYFTLKAHFYLEDA